MVTVVVTGFVLFDASPGSGQVVEVRRVRDGWCQGLASAAQVVRVLRLSVLATALLCGGRRWRASVVTGWEVVSVVARAGAGIAGVGALVEVSASQAVVDVGDVRDTWLWERAWREDAVCEQGRAEGREQGVAEGRRETARGALRVGLLVGQVVQITGLTCDEVRQLGAG